MKNILNFIKEKTYILIILTLLVGCIITVLEEHVFYFGVSAGLSLILFSVSSSFSNILVKYNYESKYLKNFIATPIIFILTFVITIIDEFTLQSEIFSHLFGLITLFLYSLFYNILILFNKETTNKKKFLGKSIKYLASSIIGYFSLAIILEEISYGFYPNELIPLIIFLNIAYVLSPIYESILEKANKGFGKIKRFLTLIIPTSGLLLLALLLEIYSEINDIIQYVIILAIPIITQIIFLVFTKRKYNEVKKLAFFKSLLLKILIIIINVFIILFSIKTIYVMNFNYNNGEWITELKDVIKEKINIEPRQLKENETYLVTKNIKIKNVFENVNVTNDLEEGSTSFIDKDGKGALISYNNFTWDDIEYESLFESIYLNDINSYYDLLKFIYDNYKNDKLSIFDDIQTLYGTTMGLVYIGSVEEISEIKIGDYVGFISKVRTDKNIYSISLFDTKNIHMEYAITLFGYKKEEVLDILTTIKLEASNNITLDLYKNANIKDFENVYNIKEDLNYNYKCLDEIDENQTCINATISINNKEYAISKLYLLKNDNYHILVNNYNGYSTLQIVNNLGEEIQNIKFQELVKINDVYIPYSLRYDEETEKLYYYELINDEYVYKSLDLEFDKEINIGY